MATSLSDWLTRLEQRAPESHIELGLARVRQVYDRLPIRLDGIPVITVTGTNGKGSTVAMLDAIYAAAAWRCFTYRSPHLFDFGERMQMAGQAADAADVVWALEAVEQARGDTWLTWFEHVTLAALMLASRAQPDVMVMEVGLGGRLDAVNLIDADVAVITSIGLDHADWLGHTRHAVLKEKLGIARPDRPLIVGERRLPAGAQALLAASRAQVYRAGVAFRWRRGRGDAAHWHWQTEGRSTRWPQPALRGDFQLSNAACALMAVALLQDRRPVDDEACRQGLQQVRLAGRLQPVGDQPQRWVDVAHNPAAARALAQALGPWPQGRTLAVFSALDDKDVAAIGRAMDSCVDHWWVAGLPGPRGQTADQVAAALKTIPVRGQLDTVESVAQAWQQALSSSRPTDRIVAFGSFRVLTGLGRAVMEADVERG